ncbi:hypothetical protein [Actinomadura sp. 3N407]|uniref:hypothetical protein n=1 Tax=Actinomadura sp. 3N407 TaxID=3457423 RepID=UPI003FCDAB0A
MTALIARGSAAGHVPWANMYEFVCAVTFAAVTALLVLFTRKRTFYLGTFVMFPVVLALGLATTTLYTPVSLLQPSQDSYWLAIAGYGCLLFNLIGINIWGSGLHSNAGV